MLVTTKQLLSAVSLCVSILDKTVTLPILQCVRLISANNRLQVISYDLVNFVKTGINTVTDTPFDICVEGKALKQYIASIQGENLELRVIGNRLTLTCGNMQHEITHESSQDFPVIYDPKNSSEYSLDTFTLKDIKNLLHIPLKEEIRMNMSGICFTKGKIVATDGFRLAVIDANEGLTEDLIVSLKFATLLSELKESTTLHISKDAVKATLGDLEIYTRPIDDMFPNYASVIPRETAYSVTIKRTELEKTLKAVSLSSEALKKVTILEINNGRLRVSAHNEEKGSESLNEIACRSNIEQFKVSFNNEYLLNMITSTTDDSIKLEFTENSKAFVMKTETMLYLLMPLKDEERHIATPEKALSEARRLAIAGLDQRHEETTEETIQRLEKQVKIPSPDIKEFTL